MTLSASMLVVVIGGVSILADRLDLSQLLENRPWAAGIGVAAASGGVVGFMASIAFSVVVYLKPGIFAGLSPKFLEKAMKSRQSLIPFFEASIEVHLQGIRGLEVENAETARTLKRTIMFFVTGMVLAVVGSVALIWAMLPI